MTTPPFAGADHSPADQQLHPEPVSHPELAGDTLIGADDEPRLFEVIGEALIDVVQQQDGTVREHAGGSPANVSLGLARLGYPVELTTWLGPDAYADIIASRLTLSGVSIAAGLGSARATPSAQAVLDSEGAASYSFDLTWDLPEGARIPTNTVAVHTGSLATLMEPGATKVIALLEANTTATLSYDPNVRPSLIEDAPFARARVEQLFGLADVVRMSDVDSAWLYPDLHPKDAARAIVRDFDVPLVVVTRGKKGALGACRSGVVKVPTKARKKDIVDRVGAGDAATAALLDGLWQAGLLGKSRREQLAAIDLDTLEAILHWCAELCAYNLYRPGANPPRRSDVPASLQLPTAPKGV